MTEAAANNSTPEDKTSANLSLLYQENAKVAAIFWEWRNKILTYFFTAIGGLFALIGWLHQYYPGRIISIPLSLGVILSVAACLLDARNGEILEGCYQFGAYAELKLHQERSGIFSSIGERRDYKTLPKKLPTYTWTLRLTFLLIGGLLLLGALWNYFCPFL